MTENKKVTLDSYFTRIQNFPISFLAVALGLMGFTLAWQKAEETLKIPFKISTYLLYFSIMIFIIILIVYLIKIFKYPHEVKKEFNHPIKLNFFPLLAKVLLIISVIYLGLNMTISKYVWWAGVILQFIFIIIVMSSWVQNTNFEIHHMNPAWFIPVVGCVIIPIAGIKHFSPELSWFFFSIGLFWWLILTTIIINRVIFHMPVPDKLVPTFFILFAPPVIGFIALTKLLGEQSVFGNLLYYFGLFMFILIIAQYKLFIKIKFYLSWWAYSFPLAALAIGTFLMYNLNDLIFFKVLSWIIFGLLNLAIIILLIKTIIAFNNKKICIEED
jgi:tellurite resistance protein